MHKFYFIITLLSITINVSSQSPAVDSVWAEYDKNYGLDVVLYSGYKNPVYYLNHHGHPYWKNEEPTRGDLVIDGKRFKNQLLNYNIEKQQFILTYLDYNKGRNQIIIIPQRIDSIIMGENIFIRSSNKELNSPFIQVLYSNKIKCYKTWRKELEIARKVKSPSGFAYTKEKTNLFLMKNDQVHKFYNKKSFLQFFDQKYRNPIKKYISEHHVKFKKISDEELSTLIKYCEDLTN